MQLQSAQQRPVFCCHIQNLFHHVASFSSHRTRRRTQRLRTFGNTQYVVHNRLVPNIYARVVLPVRLTKEQLQLQLLMQQHSNDRPHRRVRLPMCLCSLKEWYMYARAAEGCMNP